MTTRTSLAIAVLGCSACTTPGGSGGETGGGTDSGGTTVGGSTESSSGTGSGSTGDESGESSTSGSTASDDTLGSGSETDCPAVDAPLVPECASCMQSEDCSFTCDFNGCNTDCNRDECGTECVVCADERACEDDWAAGVCDGDGACIEDATPEICASSLEKGFEDDLHVRGGCSDIVVYAHSLDETLGLSMFLPDLGVNGIVAETEFNDIAFDSAQWLELRVGSDVTSQECTDVFEPPGPQIDELWLPTAGTIDVTITPSENGPVANVTLNDFVFERAGSSLALPSFNFGEITVGWFPG